MYSMFNLEEHIHLSSGMPCVCVLPFRSIYEKMAKGLEGESSHSLMQYGVPRGYARFRNKLANFLTRTRGTPVDPDALFITNGATQAITLVLSSLRRQRDTVIVERPSYFLIFDLIKSLGFHALYADLDDQGIKPFDIQATPSTGFMYTTPFFQNPTGICLGETREEQLLAYAAEHDLYIISDEVYEFLYAQRSVRPSMSRTNSNAAVIALGSFSKILGPGLRLGWIQAHPSTIAQLEESAWAQSSGGMNPILCRMVESLLDEGVVDEALLEWRRYLSNSRQLASVSIRNVFPDSRFSIPQGGYFIWVDLGEMLLSDATFRDWLKTSFRVIYVPGGKCAPGTQTFRSHLRIGVSSYPSATLQEGLQRLQQGLQSYKRLN